MYEALLERDLLRGEEGPSLDATLLLELAVAAGAPIDGRRVRDLGLPEGRVLVSVRRNRTEVVPAAFRLVAGDRVTAVVAPEAAEAAVLLRKGTRRA